MLVPTPFLEGLTAYAVPRAQIPVDLVLDANEGRPPPPALLDALVVAGPEALRRYPDPGPLERRLADRLDLPHDHVLLTAGADDGLERACRVSLAPGRRMILPEPTFAMLPRYVALTGAERVSIPWFEGPYPTDAVLARVDATTTAISVVSPSNPTGEVATEGDVRRLAAAAPHALVVLDHAYVEFGDEDLTGLVRELPNLVVLRTLSKAHGLAGLRVGYAVGSPRIIGWMRAAGHPYAVSGPALVLVDRWLDGADPAVAGYTARVRAEREALGAALRDAGLRVTRSQANFAYGIGARARWLRAGLSGLGIGVRDLPGPSPGVGSLRITCPGDAADLARVLHALATAAAPEALLFDLDGVLADVSRSYREAIVRTAATWGVVVTADEIAAAKAAGNANNDWLLTQRLLAARGVEAPLGEVTERFERRYQGDGRAPGLWRTERLLVPRDGLAALAARLPLGIVTGRPRADAERFLAAHDLGPLFRAVVCLEDAPLKPDPAPVRLALLRLGVRRAWMLGDTPDDLRAARAAAVLPLGVALGSEDLDAALTAAGAAAVLHDAATLAADLLARLPRAPEKDP